MTKQVLQKRLICIVNNHSSTMVHPNTHPYAQHTHTSAYTYALSHTRARTHALTNTHVRARTHTHQKVIRYLPLNIDHCTSSAHRVNCEPLSHCSRSGGPLEELSHWPEAAQGHHPRMSDHSVPDDDQLLAERRPATVELDQVPSGRVR